LFIVRNPGRPIAILEEKTEAASEPESGFDQMFGYSRTLMGHHAGLGALALVLLSQSSFFVGVIYWKSYGELKALVCDTEFRLTR